MKLHNALMIAPLLALALMGAAPRAPELDVVLTPRTGAGGFE